MIILKAAGVLAGAALAAVVLTALFIAISTLFIDRSKTYEEDSRFYRVLIDIIVFSLLFVARTRVCVTGLEKIPEGRFLFVQNHRSNFDPFITLKVMRKYGLTLVSKPENFRYPIVGPLIHRCMFMAIDRENPRNAIVTIDRSAKLILADKCSIGIYPEGTRNKSDEPLLPFHNGVFKVAQRANVPIVVSTLMDAREISGRFPWKRTEVRLDVLEVIPAEELKGKGTAEVGARVEEIMLRGIETARRA